MKNLFALFLLLFFAEGFSQTVATQDQVEKVDFKVAEAEINIHPERAAVEGEVTYRFEILQPTDSIFLNAENMDFRKVTLNGAPVKFNNDKKHLWLTSDFQPSEDNELVLQYSAEPKQAMYFINWNTADSLNAVKEVWTQGQGKNNSHWLPGFNDMREKVIYNLNVNFRKGYEVAANGVLQKKIAINDSIDQWQYRMKDPMSSYLLGIAAGNYDIDKRESASGVPLLLYYNPEDSAKVEPTYRHTEKIFNFLESETGVPYPWQNYKQIPVQDFLYSGMENTGTTIFSNSLVVDSIAYNDQNYVMVNAHELAHQWFGNLVTATTGEHHWLQEGFATYYAMLAEKEIFGEDYYYWKLYETAEQLKALSDEGKGEALLSSSAGSLTYYQKGAWALHILKEMVGEQAFNAAVRNYLKKYAFENVTTSDFLAEVEKASGKDLTKFRKNWLEQSAFQGTAALESLKKSEFIRNYMEIAALREIPFQNKIDQLTRALEVPVNDYIGQEAVYQIAGQNGPEAIKLYKKAFNTGNLYVRQAISASIDKIPEQLKEEFISLLEDPSYQTIENALLKLYLQYPGEADQWLQKTEGIEGNSGKNVRMLWLVINLVTPETDKEKTRKYFEELSGYTAPHYPFEVRENAFGYLYQLNAFREQNLIDLIKGAQHHTFRFRDFSRKLLGNLLQTEEYRPEFEALKEKLSPQDREFLTSRMK